MTVPPVPAGLDSIAGSGGLRDVVEGCLALHAQDFPAGAGLRLATMADLPTLVDIVDWATSQTKREGLFLRMSEEFLAEFIRYGIVLLPMSDSKILGYSNAMQANSAHPPFLDGPYSRAPGLLFGTVLGPEGRAQGWHGRLIRIRMDIFRMAGFVSVQCTVSPFNQVSLGNLLAAEFRAYGLKDMLDGHPRFLLRHDFGQKAISGQCRKLVLPKSGSVADHKALLADGYVGVSLERGEAASLCYVAGSG
ncbi:MAG: hypothetical protein F4Y60_08785 [Boseongicola sp. SB0664_bin_43]|uniref:N-acetyltransferase domain-containing protein n=1 Tax=Boseongicola sp. SB0664_bin_43 TaxID=2604844 RepID=A0A6B0Y4X7_9RHOB|nr:hypothetical protein [Boseongicola sp. SB0664_bin_43]MYK30384.1 hypothetical protein [Boseongicola sp. SB0670_bin_30]